jgi:MoxR-like ATPase
MATKNKKGNGKNDSSNDTDIRIKFLNMVNELKTVVLERETPIWLSMVALLSGEHLLLLGAPGVAKSFFIRELCKRILGALYFEKLFNQTTTPEELFGPIDLQALSERGEYRRVNKNAMQTAHIVFTDEIFKGSSVIRNTMLTLVNERLYHEVGFEPQKSPLLSLFGASNEIPSDDESGAFYDRFPMKAIITDTIEEDSFTALARQSFNTTKMDATISLEDIEQAKLEVDLVSIPDEVIDGFRRICKLDAPAIGIRVSDRSVVKCSKILKAHAWLQGRTEVTMEDLTILQHCLWQTMDQLKKVERIVFEVGNPLYLRAVEKEDAAREVFQQLPSEDDLKNNYSYNKGIADNVLTQLADMDKQLEQELVESKAADKARAAQALYQIREWKKQASRRLNKAGALYSISLHGR